MSVTGRDGGPADAGEVQAFMLNVGVALVMTGDAVSAIQDRLVEIAAGYGWRDVHVSVLPAFWLLVPGTIGLIGVTEIVGKNSASGFQHLAAGLASIPSVALGVLVGTMAVRGARIARHHHASLDVPRRVIAQRGPPGYTRSSSSRGAGPDSHP